MTKDIWHSFVHGSKAYDIFSLIPNCLINGDSWPDLITYNYDCNVINNNGLPVHFIEPELKSHIFSEGYESKIYLSGKVQTRLENWHDYFNMLIWRTFPKIKSMLNNRQYHSLLKREGKSQQRTSIENYLTLFDEGGIIVCSSDHHLLSAIQAMSWKELFWIKRERLVQNLRCFVVGHALHEKFLQPYIGMVAHAVLIQVSDNFLDLDLKAQLQDVDDKISCHLSTLSEAITPKALCPVPVLGLPDWHAQNHNESFYENSKYFRVSRSRAIA